MIAPGLDVWKRLAEPACEELVRLAELVTPGDVRGVEGLRRVCSDVEVVRAALMLAEARRKAVPKFGAERAARLWADPEGVEMATSRVVAEYKQNMFLARTPHEPLVDVCCGIGGDAMAFAEDREVLGVDIDPVRAWMAERNSGCRTLVADVLHGELPEGPVHIDPARRTGGSRTWRLEDMRPSIDQVRSIVTRAGLGGAVKLGPGADLNAVAARFPDSQIHVVSENGRLVQCVLWVGLMAGASNRSALLLRGTPDEPRGQRAKRVVFLSGKPDGVGTSPAQADARALRYIYQPDDSVERAGLLGVLGEKVGAVMLDVRVGLLTSDALIESPWVTGFEVLEVMAWHEKRVKAALEARRAGIVEVKTRGKVVDPDVVQRALRGKGDERLTVFVLRFGREVRAIVARRLASGDRPAAGA